MITIYADSSGLPGSVVATQAVGAVDRVATGDTITIPEPPFLVYDVYEYWTFIDPIALTAGTTYWLSIVNHVLDRDDVWFWTTSSSQGDHALKVGEGAWYAEETELAFNLTADAVPAPATLLLLSAGLVGLGVRRWWKGGPPRRP